MTLILDMMRGVTGRRGRGGFEDEASLDRLARLAVVERDREVRPEMGLRFLRQRHSVEA